MSKQGDHIRTHYALLPCYCTYDGKLTERDINVDKLSLREDIDLSAVAFLQVTMRLCDDDFEVRIGDRWFPLDSENQYTPAQAKDFRFRWRDVKGDFEALGIRHVLASILTDEDIYKLADDIEILDAPKAERAKLFLESCVQAIYEACSDDDRMLGVANTLGMKSTLRGAGNE